MVVSWTAGGTSTPQIGAKVEIIDEDGKVVATKEMTRPEETSMILADVAIAEYNCRLTVTDIFGQTTVTEKATDGYALKGEEPSPSEDDKSEAEPSAPADQPSASVDAPTTPDKGGNDDQDGENKSIVPVIVAVVGEIAVAVIAVGVVLIVKKKKK